MLKPNHALWLIHFCVVLWGFTAVLGKLITLPALPLVWWRLIIVSVALVLIRRFWTGLSRLTPRLVAIYAGIGLIVMLHWLLFYGSVKLANASVAATCMAMAPVFIAFIEPAIVAGRRFDARELLFGLAAIPGVMLVVGGTPDAMRWGIVVGIASALLAALFGVLNKRFIEDGDPFAITGIEMLSGLALLTLAMPLVSAGEPAFVLPNARDSLWLAVLALGCTLLPFVLSLFALRRISAFTTALAINLEPVYAILLAMLFLGEQRELEPSFYIGVAIILLVVFCHPWLVRPKAVALPAP